MSDQVDPPTAVPPSVRLDLARHPHSGVLVAFCGLDGSGKTTSLQFVRNCLLEAGMRVTVVTMPSVQARSTSYFKRYASDHSSASRGEVHFGSLALFLLADRLVTLRETIEPLLADGQWVLCDRYIWSALAEIESFETDEDTLEAIQRISCLFPKPDHSFVRDVSWQESLQRIRARPAELDFSPDPQLWASLAQGYRSVAHAHDLCLVPADLSLVGANDFIWQQLLAH